MINFWSDSIWIGISYLNFALIIVLAFTGFGDSSKSSWQDSFAGYDQQIEQIVDINEGNDAIESQESYDSCVPQEQKHVQRQKEPGHSFENSSQNSVETW